MEDRRNEYPRNGGWQKPGQPFLQNMYDRPRPPVSPPPQKAKESGGDTQILTQGGFKPLTKEQKAEAARIALEAGFSFDGYQVVRREFFSHTYDPALIIKGSSISFNNACISKLEDVIYVQVLIDPEAKTLVIRPCDEGARDAVRWCIPKEEKRKSRQISCFPFTEKLYEMMNWETLYCYKMQGTRLKHKGEYVYFFDLKSTEAVSATQKELEIIEKRARKKMPVYPLDWKNSFGMYVDEHTESTKIDLDEDYDYAGMDGTMMRRTEADKDE